jgi:hypothetical protein
MSTETQAVAAEALANAEQAKAEELSEHKTLRVIGWFSAGMAVATVGIYLGYEIRSRYKFRHRTPYDFYAHAGPTAAADFGVGI